MIRINLGAEGLGGVRFAVSPLDSAKDLIYSLRRTPQALSADWRARTREALVQHRLGLLGAVGGGGPCGYAPDFLRPESQGFETSVDAALHRVATAPIERIGYELALAVNGHPWDPASGEGAPRPLLQALDRGERSFAHRLADEMAQFWHAALEPSWPGIRARLEADVSARATAIAYHGLADTLNRLAPNLAWCDGGLTLRLRPGSPHGLTVDARAVILVPSVFVNQAIFCAGEPGAPAPRTPLIIYPAAPADCLAASGEDRLIGATRARILAELSEPRSTAELAQRLYLAPATVSYHLQILHRAGLVTRERRSRRVLYQRLGVRPRLGGGPL
ncbi:winged helix-turn-helix domain-containing protein [Kitasatospora sp. NPDC096140]|uniref:ArsR/SmtB family transcription factor n=1 Tax=Kitasatospora sp. NPDC096140 TaxID=3155425 RepID=UPI00332C2700